MGSYDTSSILKTYNPLTLFHVSSRAYPVLSFQVEVAAENNHVFVLALVHASTWKLDLRAPAPWQLAPPTCTGMP